MKSEYNDLFLEGYVELGEQMCWPFYHCGITEGDNGHSIPAIMATREEAEAEIKDYIELMNDGHADDEDFEEMSEEDCDLWVQRVRVVGKHMHLLDDDGEEMGIHFEWTAQI